ncbi:hypothetical protein [Saccharothrix deserti]|uniref:hypothetical protein n=1 Tax=Saccharothrix deserti TaxID=2593674 RepID=UPI00131B0E03|nr:hypothetical protein [Saccharothrix deserti]
MTNLAAVIPLSGRDVLAENVTAPDADVPEPATLYYLTVIAFLLHTNVDGSCPRCREVWPCDHLRLAYRLREAF